jgi:D-alanine transfer protein
MKKVGAFLLAAFIVIILLFFCNISLKTQIQKKYFNRFSDILDWKKYQGIAMQLNAAKKKDNLFIFGSSEVGGTKSNDPFHPGNFFPNEKSRFHVELIGRAYCQSLIHTLNIGALGNDLKGKKVVYIISPQWFDKTGLTQNNLKVNFSEEQFYAYMKNRNISIALKREVAERILKIIGKSDEFSEVKTYCSLIIKNNLYNESKFIIEKPYFNARSFLLELRDKIQTLRMIDNANKELFYKGINHNYAINFGRELKLLSRYSTNNPFGFDNILYANTFKREIPLMKEFTHNISVNDSMEFKDLKILFETFKEQGIEPLIVDLPMNGRWYDYCGINSKTRKLYYSKINSIVKSYNFQLLDMSKYEYAEHAFRDSAHLEWKGWIYIDEDLDKYYYENLTKSKG